MIDGRTGGVYTARTGARVFTPFFQARQIARTLGVDRTFRPAIWRTSDIIVQTRARRGITDFAAHRIRTAR